MDGGITEEDRRRLARCVELAEEALADGDGPFGSVLVDGSGAIRAEGRNREVSDGDATQHPELVLAQWAARNLSAAERADATLYTSGEHCPMCAAAHGWAGSAGWCSRCRRHSWSSCEPHWDCLPGRWRRSGPTRSHRR
ncbi:nucleoside deaminase [Pseudactinotalea suaedae]|uniref:nucleoside deaminase n=1 Tax=Pseudactinotalea suaedae TaxID=1524924 RepID=UPI00344B3257